MLVRGDGLLLGCEPQLSPITAQTVRIRSKRAAGDGITPMWMTNSATSKVIDQAPWARIDRKVWHEYLNDTELPVRGGVRSLQIEQCSRMGTVCPDKKARRPCRGWHGTWTDARQLERFDDLIVRAAARDLVPVNVRHGSTRSAWFWVPAADLDKIEPTERGDADLPLEGMIVRADSSPRLREQACRYGQDSGHRSPPTVARDQTQPVSVSLTDSAMPLKMVHLDWTGPRHWAAQALPCRVCRKPVNTRDDQARPSHKTCAEEELNSLPGY